MKNINNNTNEKIFEALEGLKETTKKAQERRDKKIWSDISIPFTLYDGLTKLTKDELNTIRQRFEIKNASGLKKGELIGLLQEKIPVLVEKLYCLLDKDRFNLVRKMVRQGGYILVTDLKDFQIEYLRSLGILFSGTHNGNKIIAMPQEVIEQSLILEENNTLKSIVHRNTEWIKLTHGLLYYYGTLSLAELIVMLEKYIKEPLNVSDYLSVIDEGAFYYRDIRIDQHGFSNARVFDPERVKQEQQKRIGVEFFPFSKEKLLTAGEPGYVERTDSYKQFVTFIIQNYSISRIEADEIVEECVYATKIGEAPKDILQYLQSRLEFDRIDTIQACMEKVVHLMNNTREWFLKGYSPEELSAQEKKALQPLKIVKNKTIGRNEPCPCGSKKKYKKCCGR